MSSPTKILKFLTSDNFHPLEGARQNFKENFKFITKVQRVKSQSQSQDIKLNSKPRFPVQMIYMYNC